jgi:hypothetical protein
MALGEGRSFTFTEFFNNLRIIQSSFGKFVGPLRFFQFLIDVNRGLAKEMFGSSLSRCLVSPWRKTIIFQAKWPNFGWCIFLRFIVYEYWNIEHFDRVSVFSAEGKSELVSGFHIEYFWNEFVEFVLIFIVGYDYIFFRFISLIIFKNLLYSWRFRIGLCVLIILIICMRAVLNSIWWINTYIRWMMFWVIYLLFLG